MKNPFIIAWDINGCLLDWNDRPIADAVTALKYFSSHGRAVQTIVWSARGKDYADYVVDDILDVRKYVWRTMEKDVKQPVDVAVDDQISFDYGRENLIVKAPKWSRNG